MYLQQTLTQTRTHQIMIHVLYQYRDAFKIQGRRIRAEAYRYVHVYRHRGLDIFRNGNALTRYSRSRDYPLLI
jgi:hypothetical protein